MSLISNLLMSDARPDSNSTKTVDDRCLPILSAPKNRYLGFLKFCAFSGEIFVAISLSLAASIQTTTMSATARNSVTQSSVAWAAKHSNAMTVDSATARSTVTARRVASAV